MFYVSVCTKYSQKYMCSTFEVLDSFYGRASGKLLFWSLCCIVQCVSHHILDFCITCEGCMYVFLCVFYFVWV